MKFDYGELKSDDRTCARRNAKAIHELNHKVTESVVEIGRRLREVRQALGAKFRAWVESEFRWSQSTACSPVRMIFCQASESLVNFPP